MNRQHSTLASWAAEPSSEPSLPKRSRKRLTLPDFRAYAVEVPRPGTPVAEGTRVAGDYLRDVIDANRQSFRLFGPDETASNRLGAVFEVTDRAFEEPILPTDDHLAPDGRVMEVLSEHLCEG